MPRCEVPFNWKCPFCNHDATIVDEGYAHFWEELKQDRVYPDPRAIEMHSIKCPNPECGRVSVWDEWSFVSPPGRDFITHPYEIIDSWSPIP